ncbi:MAG: alpha/beta hydrolase [Gemmataceae bacterium]|nr:alpha/beta hydrolase [Gemmataceae bacterium]
MTIHQSCCSWVSYEVPPERSPNSKPLVWIVDGAGDLKGCSNAIGYANAVRGQPLEVVVFPWSHGYRRLLRDQIDGEHARRQGVRLAQAILERKAREPDRRVVLIAHSAGCAVALGAGDVLPPNSVDRIILLAPSVSTGYDLRPTLQAAKEGVDVFCSKRDWVALGFVVRVVGTTDNFWSGAAAGRWGFRQARLAWQDPLVASRLRQHFWSPELAWTGHTGGHHGMHAPGFIHTFLWPLILGQ